jgi:hypothetical protein
MHTSPEEFPPLRKKTSPRSILLMARGVRGGAGNHLAQLELLGEFAAQLAELGKEGFRGRDDGFLGRERAVGLDAELDGREEGMGD